MKQSAPHPSEFGGINPPVQWCVSATDGGTPAATPFMSPIRIMASRNYE